MELDREAKRMKFGLIKGMIIEYLPEEIWIEILARLPFRSIMRFKAVQRRWREVTETSYFRSKFMFAHQNSSSSWSIMHETCGWFPGEVAGFYGCERYGLPRSLDSYIEPHELEEDKDTVIACADGLVLLQTIHNGVDETYSVGNPVLNQWVHLPPYPFKAFLRGLVTHVEDGVVVEYKVVFMNYDIGPHYGEVETLKFDIWSSKTGIWISKIVACPRRIYSFQYGKNLSLNKKLHWLDDHYRETLLAYDFFAADEQCQVISFPDEEACTNRAYTISGGFVVYIEKFLLQLRLWRLEEYTSDSGRWQFMQNIDLTSFGCDHNYFPMAMHPFETNIIYMATTTADEDITLVSIDLKTQKLTRHTKSSTYTDTMLFNFFQEVLVDHCGYRFFNAQQFILPHWMGSVPLLPSI